MAQGIDRANLHVYAPSEGHPPISLSQKQSKSDSEYIDGNHDYLEAGRPRILGHNLRNSKATWIKSKAKKLLGISGGSLANRQASKAPILAPKPGSVSGSERLIKDVPPREKVPVKEMIRDPIGTIQSVARGSGGEQFAQAVQSGPIPHSVDVQLVRAHDKLETASDEGEREQAIEKMDDLKETRQDMFVRWTMDRHVREITSVSAETVPCRERADFAIVDEQGRRRMHWAEYGLHVLSCWAERYANQYIGTYSVRPSATEEAINASVERLLLTSTPVQEALLWIRDIYHWQDPPKTARYLGLYFVLWVFDYIAPFAILTVIIWVLKRRYYPPTFAEFRDNVERSEDGEKTAHNLTQLIERHGTRGWADALLASGGPGLMMQLEDAANCLERAQNFSSWRHPARTRRAIFILSFLFLVLTFTPIWLLAKTSFFIAGVLFFGLFPISSHYPQYRLLVSPLTWLLWGIPTNTDWAIARIQAEAQHNRETMQHASEKHDLINDTTAEQPLVPPGAHEVLTVDALHEGEASVAKSEENHPENRTPPGRPFIFEVGAYHCMSQKHFGKLHVGSEGISFTTSVTSTKVWEMKYNKLKSMKKSENKAPPAYGKGLIFTCVDDESYEAYGLKASDEVFIQIIGYSGLSWKSIW